MGGIGSGSYYRWDTKTTVEECLTLDMCRFIRKSWAIPGERIVSSISWSSNGKVTNSISYEADLTDSQDGWIRLLYSHKNETLDYTISLSTTQPNYGGLRWWFICPISGQRTQKLYKPRGHRYFASRKTKGLTYQSQREDYAQRILNKSYKLRRRIDPKAEVYIEAPIPSKPKGMHQKTYQKLFDDILRLEDLGWACMEKYFAERGHRPF